MRVKLFVLGSDKVGMSGLPKTISFEVGSTCKLTCGHCWGFRLKRAPSSGKLQQVTGKVIEHHPKRVIVSGGEPLEREDLPEVLARLHEAQIRVALLTSGLGFPEKFAAVRPYVDWVGLSLDSSKPEVDAAMRGQNEHYFDVLRSLHLLQGTGIKVRVETLVTGKNLKTAGRVGEEIYCHGFRVDLWKLKEFVPSREAARHAAEYTVGREAFDDVAQTALLLRDMTGMPVSITRAEDVTNHHIGVCANGDVILYGQGVTSLGNILDPSFSIDYASLPLNSARQQRYDQEWD